MIARTALALFAALLFAASAATTDIARAQETSGNIADRNDIDDLDDCEDLNLPQLNYINGINTTDFSAYHEALAVRDVVEMAVSRRIGECDLRGNFHPQHNVNQLAEFREADARRRDGGPKDGVFRGEVSTDEFYFNASGSFAFDAIETAVMIEALAVEYNRAAEYLAEFQSGGDVPEDVASVFEGVFTQALQGAASAARDRFNRNQGPEASRPDDYRAIKGFISGILKEDSNNRVLIVGYSQGSVYGALARNDLRPAFGDRVATISIGTPLSSQLLTPLEQGGEEEPYVTSTLDRLMNGLRNRNALGGFPPAPANADNSNCIPDSWPRLHHYHGLFTDYLDFYYHLPEQELIRKCRPLELESRRLFHEHVCAVFADFGIRGSCNMGMTEPGS